MNAQRQQVDLEALIGKSLSEPQPEDAAGEVVEAGESLRGSDPEPQEQAQEVAGSAAAEAMQRIAVPPRKLQRVTVSFDVPVVAEIPKRLRQCSAETGIDIRDLASLALHQGLLERGY